MRILILFMLNNYEAFGSFFFEMYIMIQEKKKWKKKKILCAREPRMFFVSFQQFLVYFEGLSNSLEFLVYHTILKAIFFLSSD